MICSLRGIKYAQDTPFLKEVTSRLEYNRDENSARDTVKSYELTLESMRRKHGKTDSISALKHQRNSVEVIKFEKGFENKENFIRQRLEMGIL